MKENEVYDLVFSLLSHAAIVGITWTKEQRKQLEEYAEKYCGKKLSEIEAAVFRAKERKAKRKSRVAKAVVLVLLCFAIGMVPVYAQEAQDATASPGFDWSPVIEWLFAGGGLAGIVALIARFFCSKNRLELALKIVAKVIEEMEPPLDEGSVHERPIKTAIRQEALKRGVFPQFDQTINKIKL